MKLFVKGMRLLFDFGVRHLSKGAALRRFASDMGLAYIKFAQILAMQNIDGIFSEEDRQDIMNICDDCNPISYRKIYRVLVREYGKKNIKSKFRKISKKPIGSASISQVHRAQLSSGEQVVLKIKRDGVLKTLDCGFV